MRIAGAMHDPQILAQNDLSGLPQDWQGGPQ